MLILDLGTRWRWVVSVTPREKDPRYPTDKRLGGPRADLDTEPREKILFSLPGIEPQSPSRPASSQTLYWLSYPGSLNSVLGMHKYTSIWNIKHWSTFYKPGNCNVKLSRICELILALWHFKETSNWPMIENHLIVPSTYNKSCVLQYHSTTYCNVLGVLYSRWNFIALQMSVHYS
jgi:hypothetical protein